MCSAVLFGRGLDDDSPGDRSGRVRRGQFAMSFGKQRDRRWGRWCRLSGVYMLPRTACSITSFSQHAVAGWSNSCHTTQLLHLVTPNWCHMCIHRDMSREELESEHKRMKYVSEAKPALPKHKMQ
jgi:hypothetical protein